MGVITLETLLLSVLDMLQHVGGVGGHPAMLQRVCLFKESQEHGITFYAIILELALHIFMSDFF